MNRPKCDKCGREKVFIVTPMGRKIVCELCDLNIITLDKCEYCGKYFHAFVEKACECRKIENKGE